MQFNPDIFRAYDVRGRYGRDFDAAFGQRLVSQLAGYLKAGTFVVGRDGRSSSEELAQAAIDGAKHAGSAVVDIGLVSTPQFYFAIRALNAVGGIMVTASHNPEADNGFKAVARRAGTVEILGGHQLRQIFDSHHFSARSGGSLAHGDVVTDYANAVAYAANWQGGTELRLSVDAPEAVRRVLERLGPIAPDDGLAVKFDADGDRIAFYENGQMIPADLIFMMLADRLELEPLVLDLRFSRRIREVLEARGVAHELSRVGRLYVTEAMHRIGAAFGGDLSGHFYWRQFGGMEAPELTLLRVHQMLSQSGSSLAELTAPFKKYFRSEEISIQVRDKKHSDGLIAALARKYAGAQQGVLDGLTVDCWDTGPDASVGGFWFNLRPSNTEPAVRLVVEAKSKDILDQMVSQLQETLRR